MLSWDLNKYILLHKNITHAHTHTPDSYVNTKLRKMRIT